MYSIRRRKKERRELLIFVDVDYITSFIQSGSIVLSIFTIRNKNRTCLQNRSTRMKDNFNSILTLKTINCYFTFTVLMYFIN
jgi:hypothetical protein